MSRAPGAGAGRLARRWITWFRPPGRDEAQAVFLQQAGSAASVEWSGWLSRAAVLGLAFLIVLWVMPWGRAGGKWVDELLGARPGVAGWALLVCVLTVVDLVRSARSRARLASAYAAADLRLGSTFLRFPDSLAGAAAMSAASLLADLGILAGVAAALAAQALSELAIRCLVVSSGRLGMAGRVIWRGARSPMVLCLAVLLAVVRVLPAPQVPPPTPEQEALRLMSDPAVAAADAAVRDAFARARQDGSAPHDLLRLRAGWDTTHLSDGTAPAALRSDAAMLEQLGAFQAFWAVERARTYSLAEVSGRCVTSPPALPCQIQGAAAPVPGSDGMLLYRIARHAEASSGEMFSPRLLDVFQAAGPGSWAHVLHVGYDPGLKPRVPRQVSSPAGAVLILPPASPWSIQLGEVEGGNQVFLRQAATWRRMDAASWLEKAARSLPPHQCLLQTTYSMGNVPLATDIEPNFQTMSALALYGPRADTIDRAAGRAEFRFGIEDRTLVVRDTILTPYADDRPWWRRWLQPGPEC